jgi:hypothetical protein
MRVRALSPSGDFTFGQGQGNFLSNSPAAVAQCIATALQLWAGEWYLDLSAGVRYQTQILGNNTSGLYDAEIQRVIKGVQGVTQIVSYSSNLDRAARRLTVSGQVQTKYSTTPVAFNVGISV